QTRWQRPNLLAVARALRTGEFLKFLLAFELHLPEPVVEREPNHAVVVAVEAAAGPERVLHGGAYLNGLLQKILHVQANARFPVPEFLAHAQAVALVARASALQTDTRRVVRSRGLHAQL